MGANPAESDTPRVSTESSYTEDTATSCEFLSSRVRCLWRDAEDKATLGAPVNDGVLAQIDRGIAALSPAKREAVREIVVDAVHRGHLPPRNRETLNTITGSTLAGDVLVAHMSPSTAPAANTLDM